MIIPLFLIILFPHYRQVLELEVNVLKSSLSELNMEHLDDKDFIRHLKGEVFVAQDAMLSEKDEFVRAQLQVDSFSTQLATMQE